MSVKELKSGIRIYSGDSVERIKQSAAIAKEVLSYALTICQIGNTTFDIEKEIENRILKAGGTPAFKGYEDFPYSACISVNDYIVHGAPTKHRLKDGDVVSLDLGVIYEGFYSDTARTKILGTARSQDTFLVEAAEECFKAGLEFARIGNSTGDIGHAIHRRLLKYKSASGESLFNIFHNFQGHGIGLTLHEPPSVPNFGFPNGGERIVEGMCFCIEPVLLYRGAKVESVPMEGTNFLQFKTQDGSSTTHYENQIYMSHSGPIVLTI